MTDDFIIFAGTANPELAASVARELGVRLGLRRLWPTRYAAFWPTDH